MMTKTIATLALLSLIVCSCKQSSSGGDQEAAHTGSGELDGIVKASSHPNVKTGSVCNGSFVLRGTKRPATLRVKCDGVTIYDGEGVAKNNVNDKSNPDDDTISFTDDKTSDADKTPALSLVAQEGKADGDSGIMTVHDVKNGNVPAFEITISI